MDPHGFILPSRIIGLFVLAAGLIPLVLGTWLYFESRNFLASATPTSATVTELIPAHSIEGDTTYSTVFQFEDANGVSRKGTSSWSSNPPAHAVGETISIRYDPTDPSDARIDSFLSPWLIVIVCGIALFVDLCVALLFLWIVPLTIRRVWPRDAPNAMPHQATGFGQ